MSPFDPRRLTAFFPILLLAAAPLNAQSPTVAPLLDGIQAEDPLIRAEAFDALLEGGYLDLPEVSGRLLDALERENELIESVLRESNGFVGVATLYGEAYNEYYLGLLSTVNRLGNHEDQRTLDALTNGSYGPASPFAVRLMGLHGERMAALLLAKSASDLYVFRMSATEMLGGLVSNGMLSDATLESVMAAIARNTTDEEIIVRATAVDTLGQVGDLEDLPLLRQIARSDPGETLALIGEVRRYPVRERAERAIAEIQRRHPL